MKGELVERENEHVGRANVSDRNWWKASRAVDPGVEPVLVKALVITDDAAIRHTNDVEEVAAVVVDLHDLGLVQDANRHPSDCLWRSAPFRVHGELGASWRSRPAR